MHVLNSSTEPGKHCHHHDKRSAAFLFLIRMYRLRVSPALILAMFFLSCEKSNLGTIDANREVPQLLNASVTPDSVYIDNLTPTGGQYLITATIRVTSTVGSSATQTVTATVVRPNSAAGLQQLTLTSTGGGAFEGQVQLSISRAQAGKYRILFASRTSEGLQGNTIEVPLKLARRNSAPILTSVSIPDSVQLPTTDTLRVQFVAAAADSDGIDDIREVFFRRVSPPDPTKFLMKDDGGLEPPIGIGGIAVRSGDDVAGDGRFSFLIPILPTSTRRTNVFEFQCIDSFGDTSSSIQRSFTIR